MIDVITVDNVFAPLIFLATIVWVSEAPGRQVFAANLNAFRAVVMPLALVMDVEEVFVPHAFRRTIGNNAVRGEGVRVTGDGCECSRIGYFGSSE
jgi:hypothetical protein